MRAGRLKTRRYKTRRRGVFLLMLLFLAAALGCGVMAARKSGFSFLPAPLLSPASTLPPEDAARESREVTLPGQSWYALCMLSMDEESAARSQAAALQNRGAGGYVRYSQGYQVLGAAYESRADAQLVADQLKSLHGLSVQTVAIDRPEITLRLSGQRAQLTVLEDAYCLADQAAQQLSALSRGLDEHSLDAASVRAALSSLQDTAAAMRDRLILRFGDSPVHAAVGNMINLLGSLHQALDQALPETGAARLGAKVKYCQLLCVCRMAEHAALLSGNQRSGALHFLQGIKYMYWALLSNSMGNTPVRGQYS